jgi:hypothetical protein
LGAPDADDRIAAVEEKERTILLLDALDEDTQAIVDHIERLRILIRNTQSFYRVVVSCRTQFFSTDDEIPRRTGLIKVTSRAAGEPAEYCFHKIYISPFLESQVAQYIRRRYPIWQYGRRRVTLEAVKMMPNLSVRPMLLAHVDDLIRAGRRAHYSFELYEEMVEAWLVREEGFISDRESLRLFSELLAVDLYVNRASRGAERIPGGEIGDLAWEWGIRIDKWVLTGRSLLNRDFEGNYKFAHRSIMEYLVVVRTSKNDPRALSVQWTDQMKAFFSEIVDHQCSLGYRDDVFCGLVRTTLSYRAPQSPREQESLAGVVQLLGEVLFFQASLEQLAKRFVFVVGGLLPTYGTVSFKVFSRKLATMTVNPDLMEAHISDSVGLLWWLRGFPSTKSNDPLRSDNREDVMAFRLVGGTGTSLEFNFSSSITNTEVIALSEAIRRVAASAQGFGPAT